MINETKFHFNCISQKKEQPKDETKRIEEKKKQLFRLFTTIFLVKLLMGGKFESKSERGDSLERFVLEYFLRLTIPTYEIVGKQQDNTFVHIYYRNK